jgi:hypothetical protein
MKHSYSGITIWYGTADAPAPLKVAPPGAPLLIVGVRPAHPANVVRLHFRVNGGALQVLKAVQRGIDFGLDHQYFEVNFPSLPLGAAVRYVVVCDSAGRRAPDPATIASMPAAFEVTAGAAVLPKPTPYSPAVAPTAIPADLATARSVRRQVYGQVRQLRRDLARVDQNLESLRRRGPPPTRTVAPTLPGTPVRIAPVLDLKALQSQRRTLGAQIAQRVADLRSLGARIQSLKTMPGSPPGALPGISDAYPILLFPVRIETRFDAPTSASPRLLVRIYPDQLAIDRHEPGLTTTELRAGRVFQREQMTAQRQLAAIPQPLDEAGRAQVAAIIEGRRAAWRKLADRFGSARAAYIAKCAEGGFRVETLPDDGWMPPPRAQVLPDFFCVTLHRGNAQPRHHFTTAVDDELAMLWDRQTPPTGEGELFDAGSRWLADFSAAEAAGMAVAITLTPDDVANGFSAVTVVGIRSSMTAAESTALVEQFIDQHHFTDGVAFLAPGTPTNNTAAEPSGHAESRDDVEQSFDVQYGAVGDAPSVPNDAQRLAAALGIQPSALAGIEGERSFDWARAGTTQRLLWPATGEYVLRHLLPDTASDTTRGHLAQHFRELVRARGPLPLIRIGKLPYGILPVTKLRGWQPSAADGFGLVEKPGGGLLEFHTRLHRLLMVLRDEWLALAGRTDLVPRLGATLDPDQELLAILGMSPGCSTLRIRKIVDDRFVGFLLPMLIRDVIAGRTQAAALSAARAALHQWDDAFGRLRRNTAVLLGRLAAAAGVVDSALIESRLTHVFGWGETQPLTMPLVLNPGSPDGDPAKYLLDLAFNRAPARTKASETLLFELSTYGIQLAGTPTAALELVRELSVTPAAVLEGLLRDTLDLCTHRLDAWITSLATLRLRAMRNSAPSQVYIGAFGWVEDLRYLGDQGADGGFIHAPSVAHAAAAGVLRNTFLTHQGGAGPNPFAVNLSSERVRRATELMDGVRKGQPLSVLLGYQFERALHDRQRDVHIATFRAAYPLVANAEVAAPAGTAVEAIAARNVVDGLKLATAWRDTRPDAPTTPTSVAIKTGLTVTDPAVIDSLEWLIDALDAVGDVLLTEGVFQSVQGNYERSSAALDALAGIGPPPELESLRTPLPGTGLEHRVCAIFDGTGGAPLQAGPRAAAEPRLAAWLADLLGQTSAIECQVVSVPPGNGSQVTTSVSLANLGLDAVDLMYASAVPASGELTELERRVAYFVRSQNGLQADSQITIDFGRVAGAGRSLGEAMEVGQRVLDFVAAAQPLTPEALILPEEAHLGPTLDASSITELETRITAAQTELNSLANAIEPQLTPALVGQSIDPAGASGDTLADQLIRLSRFGIEGAIPDAPVAHAAALERFAGAVAEARDRSTRCSKRLAEARAFATGTKTVIDASGAPVQLPPAQAYAHAVEELRQAMKSLFGERFVALPTFSLGPTAGNELARALGQVHVTAGNATERIQLWLQQVALSHTAAGRLEDVMLASEAWRTAAVPANGAAPGSGSLLEIQPATARSLRVAQLPFDADILWLALSDSERDSSERPRSRVSIVALAPDSFDPTVRLAGLLVERWQETIPGKDVSTGVSFNFDRPNSQAPQTLLLAVPHTWGGSAAPATWNLADLIEIVRDTAELTRIRAVDPDALHGLTRLLPALMVPMDPQRPGWSREIPVPDAGTLIASI